LIVSKVFGRRLLDTLLLVGFVRNPFVRSDQFTPLIDGVGEYLPLPDRLNDASDLGGDLACFVAKPQVLTEKTWWGDKRLRELAAVLGANSCRLSIQKLPLFINEALVT
jgi:hypothetical protein